MSTNIALIQESFERIKPNAEQFVVSFYENLLTAYPEVQPLFAKVEMEKQYKKLLNSLILVVENLHNPDALALVLKGLGARHIGYGALPSHYPAVKDALLTTFEQYLQEDWTSEVRQAWEEAITAVSTQMLKGAGVENRPENAQSTPLEISPEITSTTSEILQTENEAKSASSELSIEILEQSFNKIKPNAQEFVVSFYENLFLAYPEVKPLFAHVEMNVQYKKLLNSLILVVENLRNSEALGPVLEALGARHVGYGTLPKYYRPVVETLLKTFEQYLGQDWTPEIEQAWVTAFRKITTLMLKGSGIEPPAKKAKIEQKSTIKTANELTVKTQDSSPSPQKQSSELRWQRTLQDLPKTVINTFWILPAWLLAMISATLMAVIFVFVDDNSIPAKILGGADTISLVVALVLFIKEAPDRRKQFHYQAWSTVDAAHGLKVSYARILALQDLNADGVPLRGLDSPGAELVKIDLSKVDLSEANLSEADLSYAQLSYANLNNANLSGAKLIGANLQQANLSFSRLNQVNFSSANLSEANLICADLSQANLSGANLKNASLSGVRLEGAYLTGANLKNAKISLAELKEAFLEGAILPDGSKYQAQNFAP